MHLALKDIAIHQSSPRGWFDEMHSRWLRLVTSPSPPGHVGKLRASANGGSGGGKIVVDLFKVMFQGFYHGIHHHKAIIWGVFFIFFQIA